MLYITNSGASSCETRRGATALRTGYHATAPLLVLVSPGVANLSTIAAACIGFRLRPDSGIGQPPGSSVRLDRRQNSLAKSCFGNPPLYSSSALKGVIPTSLHWLVGIASEQGAALVPCYSILYRAALFCG